MSELSRRHFCLSAAALLARPACAAPDTPCILASPTQVAHLRTALGRDSSLSSIAALVRKNADAALKKGPWSVTYHRPDFIKAGPNDYYSEGPYWWPDPKNPKGPYIRKDGERNPDRYLNNRNDLGSLCTAVMSLGLGSLLGDRRYGEHAARILSVWFVDPKTRMNPNLEYGQAVRGINTGRGTGIIDTVSMIHTAQGVMLLEQSGMLVAKLGDGVRTWFADYMKWMNTSQKGLDEKKSGNNHATWWTAQVAAYATLAGDQAMKQMAWEHYRTYLVPTEVKADGSCPREEERTQSLSYSAMNLDAFSVLCRIAEVNGVSLWNFRTAAGLGIEKSFHYLMPYVGHPDTWSKQQITKFDPDSTIFPGLAGVGLKSEELLAGYRALPRSQASWVQWVDLVVRGSKS
ncbi:MAG TPA: alginate lyase family protein [Bryobacteraceae bacterium]|nr:alginate lyase family protein [Bryobacteraceae bacterium]